MGELTHQATLTPHQIQDLMYMSLSPVGRQVDKLKEEFQTLTVTMNHLRAAMETRPMETQEGEVGANPHEVENLVMARLQPTLSQLQADATKQDTRLTQQIGPITREVGRMTDVIGEVWAHISDTTSKGVGKDKGRDGTINRLQAQMTFMEKACATLTHRMTQWEKVPIMETITGLTHQVHFCRQEAQAVKGYLQALSFTWRRRLRPPQTKTDLTTLTKTQRGRTDGDHPTR